MEGGERKGREGKELGCPPLPCPLTVSCPPNAEFLDRPMVPPQTPLGDDSAPPDPYSRIWEGKRKEENGWKKGNRRGADGTKGKEEEGGA